MVVSINQPAYLPWLGYFDRIAASDIHIVLDHVQYEKNSLANRNKLRTKEGWCWITVPLKTKGRFENLAIDTLEVENQLVWGRKHFGTMQMNYARSAHFSEYKSYFEKVLMMEWTLFNNLLQETLTYLLKALGIKTKILFSSKMQVVGQKDELVLNLCRAVGAQTYLSGPMGRDYLDCSAFAESDIQLLFQKFDPPFYPQAFPGFESGLSVVDLLFNCGEESRSFLSKGSQYLES